MQVLQQTSQPRKVALLIGCPGRNLRGITRDLDNIARCLQGFETVRCEGNAATRGAILDRLDQLASTITAGDAVCIYYSGHGGRARFLEPLAPGAPIDYTWHYIAAQDHQLRGPFHGILGLELSEIVAQLADITQNVTVILDCCFSATMVRDDDDERVKSLGHASFERPAHLPRLLSTVSRLAARRTLHSDSHPDVVRLVATSSQRPALETYDDRGHLAGLFTTELCRALEHRMHAKVPWATIIEQVRERLILLLGSEYQRPELEGPRGRLLFSSEEVELGSHVAFVANADRRSGVIRAGCLHGIEVGDRLRLLGPHDTGTVDVRVSYVRENAAVVEACTDFALPSGSLGYLVSSSHRTSIDVRGPEPLRSRIARRIDTTVRLAASVEGPSDLVLRADDHLALEHDGRLIRVPMPLEELQLAIEDMEAVARARRFAQLCEAAPSLNAKLGWALRIMRIEGDNVHVLDDGEVLHTGDRLCFEIANTSSYGHHHLFFNLFDHGVSGRLTLFNASEPAGIELPPGGSKCLFDEPGRKRGIGLVWPKDVPDDIPRPFALLLVVSTGALDLRTVTTKPPRLVIEQGIREPEDEKQKLWQVADVGWTAVCRHFTLDARSRSEVS